MALTTVADWIATSLKRIGVLQPGEVPTPEDQSDAFDIAQMLMDGWQTERLLIYTITRTTFAIVANQRDYSVGGARTVFVDHLNYYDTTVTPIEELSLGDPLTPDQWAAWPTKTLTSPLPAMWYYEPTFPTATISLLPVPTSTTLQGVLYAPNAIPAVATVNDLIAQPPGYKQFMVDNLAIALHPTWLKGQPIDAELQRSAIASKANIKRVNMRPLEMSTGWEGAQYDIYSDTYITR